MLWKFYHKNLNYFVDSKWSIDKKRKYRQTTGVIYFSCLFAFLSLLLSIYYELKYAIILEIINIIFCFYAFNLLKIRKLKLTQNLCIYYFEIQVFITALLFSTPFSNSLAWSYPLLMITAYPAVAALFDLSIIKHFTISTIQIILFQGLFNLNPSMFFVYNSLFEHNNEFLIKIVSFSYLLMFNTIIIFLIYKEQVYAKENVIKFSNKLKLKNQRIEELNKSKDKLFSIISHDLRNPFNSIIGFSDLLLESKELNSKERMYSDIINKSSKDTLTMIDNLLYWSKAQLNSIQPNFKNHNIKNIIDEVINTVQPSAIQKNIFIENNTSNNIIAYVDVILLQIIIRNLITNSIKFSNSNGIIKINAFNKSNQCLNFSVSDNGVGMNKQALQNLFNKNISELGTNKEKGSGLGLLLCKEFVDLHHGEIWVESEEGKGTVISFTIPLSNLEN